MSLETLDGSGDDATLYCHVTPSSYAKIALDLLLLEHSNWRFNGIAKADKILLMRVVFMVVSHDVCLLNLWFHTAEPLSIRKPTGSISAQGITCYPYRKLHARP
jgi:hypothetical protein